LGAIVEFFTDEWYSAKETNRPGYQLMMSDLKKKKKHFDQGTLKLNQRYQLEKVSWPAIVSEGLFNSVQDQIEAATDLERTRLKAAKPRL
tara:strand:- start:2983 stop:3252 length:270 start_codon:yes stop_codon:yes gene_type:complete